MSDQAAPASPGSRLRVALAAPVDAAPLAFFRIALGALLFWNFLDYLFLDWVRAAYVSPDVHFPYPGFAWLQPWSGEGMLTHFCVLTVAAATLAIGWWSRLSSAVLFLGCGYVFLLDRSLFNNHDYLIVLLCALAALLPLGRLFSRETRENPAVRIDAVPAWTLWLLRFQVAVVYLFGALSKCNSDWLLRGEPFGSHVLSVVANHSWLSAYTESFESLGMWRALSWAGLLFDLLIVPALLWRRTRVLAVLASFVFHALNSWLFHIGIFPLLAFCLTLLFVEPTWMRRVLRLGAPAQPQRLWQPSPRAWPWLKPALLVYVVLQCLLPLRPYLHTGHPSWTERGTLCAWRMMISRKESSVDFFVQDAQGAALECDWRDMLAPDQMRVMSGHPEMIVEFAHALRRFMESKGHAEVQVFAISLCALNGRNAQPLVRGDVDLSRAALADDSWRLPLKPLPR